MKRLLYMIIGLLVLSMYGCSWDEGPADIIEDNQDGKGGSHFTRDTIVVGIRLDELPYADEYIKMSSDSFSCSDGNVVVYMNSHIYIDANNDYDIVEIGWLPDDIDNKAIQLVSEAQKQVYWCGSNCVVDSLNIWLTKKPIRN